MSIVTFCLLMLCGIYVASRSRVVKEACIQISLFTLLASLLWLIWRPHHIVATIPHGASLPSLVVLICLVMIPIESWYANLFVISASAVALVGHVVNRPWLYWHIDGASRGMPAETALCFIVLGVVKMIFNPHHGS